MTLLTHWVNSCQDAGLELSDRGYRYGDALFETLRCHAGHWRLLDYHLQRLQRGCEKLEIPYPEPGVQSHLQAAVQWLDDHGITEASARLVVSRGSGGQGYGGASSAPVIGLSLARINLAWGQATSPARLVSCDITMARQPRLAGIKHANRLEQVLAAREVQRKQADEGILATSDGEVICAVAANIFAVFDEVLLTPPIVDCGVAGTVRRLLLEKLAGQAGLVAREAHLSTADLLQARELLLTNALVGIRSVASLDGHEFPSMTCGDQLRQYYFANAGSTLP